MPLLCSGHARMYPCPPSDLEVPTYNILPHRCGEDVCSGFLPRHLIQLELSPLEGVLYPEFGRFNVPGLSHAGTVAEANGGLRGCLQVLPW